MLLILIILKKYLSYLPVTKNIAVIVAIITLTKGFLREVFYFVKVKICGKTCFQYLIEFKSLVILITRRILSNKKVQKHR